MRVCVCVSAHVCLQDCTKCEAVITRTATNSNKSAREWEYASQRMLTQTPYLYTEKEAADIVKECVAKHAKHCGRKLPQPPQQGPRPRANQGVLLERTAAGCSCRQMGFARLALRASTFCFVCAYCVLVSRCTQWPRRSGGNPGPRCRCRLMALRG